MLLDSSTDLRFDDNDIQEILWHVSDDRKGPIPEFFVLRSPIVTVMPFKKVTNSTTRKNSLGGFASNTVIIIIRGDSIK